MSTSDTLQADAQARGYTPSALEAQFLAYHRRNPDVYDQVKKLAYQLLRAGHEKFSINSIIEQIRWQSALRTQGSRFKIPNNSRAYYARLFIKDHPQYKNFFSVHQTKAEVKSKIVTDWDGTPV